MATTWSEVAAKPEYQALSDEDKEATRNLYFQDVVAPQVPTDQLEATRTAFDEDTKPTLMKSVKNTAASVVKSMGLSSDDSSVMDQPQPVNSPQAAARAGINMDKSGKVSTVSSRAQDISVDRAAAPNGGPAQDTMAQTSTFIKGSNSPRISDQDAVTIKPEKVLADASDGTVQKYGKKLIDGRSLADTYADLGKDLMSGLAGVSSAAGQAEKFVGMNKVGQALIDEGDAAQQYWASIKSPYGQEVSGRKFIKSGDFSTFGNAINTLAHGNFEMGDANLDTIAGQAVQSAPGMVAMGGVGKLATAGMIKLGALNWASKVMQRALGVSAPAAEKVTGFISDGVAFGGSEGVFSGLQNAAQTGSQIRAMPMDKLSASPNFQKHLAEQDPSLPQKDRMEAARNAAADDAEAYIFKNTILTTGGISALTGGGVFGIANRGAGTAVGRAAKGVMTEGLLQEFPQSGIEQYWQNEGVRKFADPTQNPSEGVAEQAIQGGIVGGVMGAGGAFSPDHVAAVDPNAGALTRASQIAAQQGINPDSVPAGSVKADTPLGEQSTAQPPERTATSTGEQAAPPFMTPHDVALRDHQRLSESLGLNQKQTDAMAPKPVFDHVTGFHRAEDKVPTVKRVLNYVRQTGNTAHFVDADIANLGGLNTHFKNDHVPANAVYRAISGIFAEEMHKAGSQDAVMIRHGGDEISAVVVGSTNDKVNQAMEKARTRIDSYIKNVGLSDIPHPKHPGDASRSGVGLYMGQSDIVPNDSLDDIFSRAARGIDSAKKGVPYVRQNEGATARAGASGEQAAGVRGSGEEAGRGARQANGEEPVTVGGGTGNTEGKTAEQIDKAAHEAATSPHNDLPEPTQPQIEAGNYKKGHISLHGLNFSIENPQGSDRSGTDPNGKPWSVTLPAHYGYIKRTEGADGDHVDAYIGHNPESEQVFVVDQQHAGNNKFDEHKVMIGFDSESEAVKTYKAGFSDGRGAERIKSVTPMSMDEFKGWLKNGDTTKPIESIKNAQPHEQSLKQWAVGHRQYYRDKFKLPEDVINSDMTDENLSQIHLDFIETALEEGKTVPPEALAGHPSIDAKGYPLAAKLVANMAREHAGTSESIADKIRPIVESLIKRRRVALQLGLNHQFDKALAKAKAVLNDGTGKSRDFTSAAKLFKGRDDEIYTSLLSIADILKPKKGEKKTEQKASTDLIGRIKQLGGIDAKYKNDIMVDAPLNIRMAFSKNGQSADDMVSMLEQSGFVFDENENKPEDKLREALHRYQNGERNFKHAQVEDGADKQRESEYLFSLEKHAKTLGIDTNGMSEQQLEDAVYAKEDELEMAKLDASAGYNEGEIEVLSGIIDDPDAADELDIPFGDNVSAKALDDFFGYEADHETGNAGKTESTTPAEQAQGTESRARDIQEPQAGDGFALEGQTNAEVAAKERAAEQAARDKEAQSKADQAAKDHADLFARKKAHAENPDNFQFGESSKDALKPHGDIFAQPAQPSASTRQGDIVALDDIPEDLKITLKKSVDGKTKKKLVDARKAMLIANQQVEKLEALKRCLG